MLLYVLAGFHFQPRVRRLKRNLAERAFSRMNGSKSRGAGYEPCLVHKQHELRAQLQKIQALCADHPFDLRIQNARLRMGLLAAGGDVVEKNCSSLMISVW
jgi:hypothetical protein